MKFWRREFAVLLILFVFVLVSPLKAGGLSDDQLLALKKLGFKDSDLIKVIQKKKISFALTDDIKKKLVKAGFSQKILEVIDSSLSLDLDKVIELSKQKKSPFELIKKIRGAGLVVKKPSAEEWRRLGEAKVAPAVIFALTHKKGALTFKELKDLLEKKTPSDALILLFQETSPLIRLDALQSADLLQAGATLDFIKALRFASFTEVKNFRYKVQLPPKWKFTSKEALKGKLHFLKVSSPNGVYVEIRSEVARGMIDFKKEKGRKIFQKVIAFFQDNVLSEKFSKISLYKPKGAKSAFKQVKLNGKPCIRAEYRANMRGRIICIVVYYLSRPKNMYVLWTVYAQKVEKEGKKGSEDIFQSFTVD